MHFSTRETLIERNEIKLPVMIHLLKKKLQKRAHRAMP